MVFNSTQKFKNRYLNKLTIKGKNEGERAYKITLYIALQTTSIYEELDEYIKNFADLP